MKKGKRILNFEYIFLFLVLSLSISLVLISNTKYSSTLYKLAPFIYNSTISADKRSKDKIYIDNEIVELKKQLVSYKLKLNSLGDIIKENKDLKSILRLKDSLNLTYIPAKVTNYTKGSYKYKLYAKVNLDSIDLTGSPVIGLNGVVGIVKSHLEGDLSIEMINKPGFKLSVITQKRRYPSLSIPKNETTGYLKELTKTREIAVGETVYTSSFGTIFPKNIPVGVIKSYFDDEATIVKNVEISYIENLLSLETVFILKKPSNTE
ncbi:MAG: hypothetical protein CSA15_03840 [Candidatus Delongbacteria bacterium]|nr:MAG: hypothetical protein CSA15_03840 [Candidatus Delongbacteria bacterium]